MDDKCQITQDVNDDITVESLLAAMDQLCEAGLGEFKLEVIGILKILTKAMLEHKDKFKDVMGAFSRHNEKFKGIEKDLDKAECNFQYLNAGLCIQELQDW